MNQTFSTRSGCSVPARVYKILTYFPPNTHQPPAASRIKPHSIDDGRVGIPNVSHTYHISHTYQDDWSAALAVALAVAAA